MAGERDDVALAEAEELDLTAFINRENARERGEAVGPPPPPAPETPPAAEVHEPDEPEEPAREEPPASEPPRPRAARHDRQARMQEAIAKQRQAERERDEARAQLAALRQAPAPPQPQPQPQQQQQEALRNYQQPQQQLVGPQTSGFIAPAPMPADDPEPTLAQFANEADPYTAWILAKTDHQNRQRFRAYQQQFQNQQVDQHNRMWASQLKEGLDAQWAKYRTEHPDFEQQLDPEVTGALRYHGYMPDGRFDKGTQLGNLVAISGLAPNLLSYFSTHKADFQKIQALEPPDEPYPTPASVAKRVLQGVEFGRVVERLTGNGNGRQQPVSQARPPIRRPAAAPVPGNNPEEPDNDLSEAALLRHIREGNAAEGRNRHLRRLRG